MPDTIQAVTRFPLDSSWSRSATPFLMSPYTLSTRHQRFAYAHLQISHLTGSCPAFSVTLTTLTLNQRSSRWFGNYSWKSLPEGHPPSFLQLRANPSCSRGTPEPYVKLSLHTAPPVHLFINPVGATTQWGNQLGFILRARFIRRAACISVFSCLYFAFAQRLRRLSK